MNPELFKPKNTKPLEKNAVIAILTTVDNSTKTGTNTDQFFRAVYEADEMGLATMEGFRKNVTKVGKLPGWQKDLKDQLDAAKAAGEWDRVQELVRVGHLMGLTEPRSLGEKISQALGRGTPAELARFQAMWDEAEQEKQNAVQAAAQAQAQAQAAAAQAAAQQAAAQARAQAAAAAATAAAAAAQPTSGSTPGSAQAGTGTTTGSTTGTGRRTAGSGAGARTTGATSRPTGPAGGPTGPATAPSTGPAKPANQPVWEIFERRMLQSFVEEEAEAKKDTFIDSKGQKVKIDQATIGRKVKQVETKKKVYLDAKDYFEDAWTKVTPIPGRDQIAILGRYETVLELMREFAAGSKSNKNPSIAAAMSVLFPKIWSNERARRNFMGPTPGNGIYPDEQLGLYTYLPRSVHDYIFDPLLLEPNYAGSATKLRVPSANLKSLGVFKRMLFNRYHPDLYPDPDEQKAMRKIYNRFNHYWDALMPYIEEVS